MFAGAVTADEGGAAWGLGWRRAGIAVWVCGGLTATVGFLRVGVFGGCLTAGDLIWVGSCVMRMLFSSGFCVVALFSDPVGNNSKIPCNPKETSNANPNRIFASPDGF